MSPSRQATSLTPDMSDAPRHEPEEEPSTLTLLGRTLRARLPVIAAVILVVIGVRLVTEPGESQAWLIALAAVVIVGVVTDRLRDGGPEERSDRT